MLDSLGSTLSRATIRSFYTRFGLDPADGELAPDQLVQCLEAELARPVGERPRIRAGAEGFVDPSGINTPGTMTPSLDAAISMADNAQAGGFDFGGPMQTSDSPGGKLPSVTRLPGTANAPDVPTAAAQALRQLSLDSTSHDEGSPPTTERVLNIKRCPFCRKPRLGKRSEVDIVTHLSICASQDWSSLNSLLVSSFVTSSQAHRKFFSRALNKLSNGRYALGADSANIIVANRLTGELQEEKISIYVRVGIRLLYKGLGAGRMEGARSELR